MPAQSGTVSQSVKRPPVACAPHSIRWHARPAWASLSYSSNDQPNPWAAMPSSEALSTQRPVMTMSAPARKASAMGQAPKYALADISGAGAAGAVAASGGAREKVGVGRNRGRGGGSGGAGFGRVAELRAEFEHVIARDDGDPRREPLLMSERQQRISALRGV